MYDRGVVEQVWKDLKGVEPMLNFIPKERKDKMKEVISRLIVDIVNQMSQPQVINIQQGPIQEQQ